MRRIVMAVLVVLLIVYIVPFAVYGLASVFGGLEPPKNTSPAAFLLGVLVTKVGTAIGFVLLLDRAWHCFCARRWLYAGVWWAMFVLGEFGQAIGPNYSWLEALAGIVSEAIYFPLSSLVAFRLLRRPAEA